jgi:hypothetical protein
MDADKIVRPTPNIRSTKLIWFKMVLDAGRIVGDKPPWLTRVLTSVSKVEFDRPKVLLKKEHGMLRALVNESGDKDALYKIAEA